MTGKPFTLIRKKGKLAQFPDFPPRQDMQNWLYLYRRSFPTALTIYLGSPETTVAGCEIPLSPSLRGRQNLRIPDLMVSYNADPELLAEQRGYAIDTQGKPPDFVLEVASPATGVSDYTVKRSDYERYGVLEYWRFDPSGGNYHDAALAGDRLVDGRYAPITIEWLDDSRCRGFSDALGIFLCWEQGELRWFNAATGNYLQTHEADSARADRAEARAERAEAELRRLREQLGDSNQD